MLLLKGDPGPGSQPDETKVSLLAAYVQELARAGILLAAETFRQPSDLVAGYILIDVRSREEAIQWASRCPIDLTLGEGETTDVEVRRVLRLADAR